MTEIPMRRDGNKLVCTSPISEEMIQEVPLNKELLVAVKAPRNTRQFKLSWALADIVSKSVEFLQDRESAMDWLKIKARHVRMIHDPRTGKTAIVPKSISFASLSQEGFRRVLDRMIYVTITEIIPGLEEGALRAELEAIVGLEPAARAPSHERKGGRGHRSGRQEPVRSGAANVKENAHAS